MKRYRNKLYYLYLIVFILILATFISIYSKFHCVNTSIEVDDEYNKCIDKYIVEETNYKEYKEITNWCYEYACKYNIKK